MTISTRATIKAFFETGDKPTQSNFSDFIDSAAFLAEVSAQVFTGSIFSPLVSATKIEATTVSAGTANLNTLNITTLNVTTVSATTGNFGTVNAATVSATNIRASTLTAAVSASTLTSSGATSLKGTTTNDSAAVGFVGEFKSSVVLSGSAITLSNGTNADITSLSLTAGDWDVWGIVHQSNGSLNITSAQGWINSTSVTAPDSSLISQFNVAGASNWGCPIVSQRISLASTTSLFLSTFSAFGAGTTTAYGGIYARRVR